MVVASFPLSRVHHHLISCFISRLDGAIHWMEWRDALWDSYITAAPQERKHTSSKTAIASFERWAEQRARDQCKNRCEMAKAASGRG